MGSSPHTRGARRRCRHRRTTGRIIPAYAGSTRRRCRWPPAGRDHPRIRGEHRKVLGDNLRVYGSSPHTRGARSKFAGRADDGGIIPAYAGSTPLAEIDPRQVRGSSPHTRGAPEVSERVRGRRRIIPAYAGSTSQTMSASTWTADHPRIRGEHVVPIPGETLACGSSPHTRGAPRSAPEAWARVRIIPAYAGSTAP